MVGGGTFDATCQHNGVALAAGFREVLNAIRYMVRSSCEWRMLPIHFPPSHMVYWWSRRFVRRLLFQTIHDVGLMIDREWAGRQQQSSVIDRQSLKPPAAGGTRGFEGAKNIVGRERHIAIDQRRPAADQTDDGRYLRQRRRSGHCRCDPQTLALHQAPVCRRRL